MFSVSVLNVLLGLFMLVVSMVCIWVVIVVVEVGIIVFIWWLVWFLLVLMSWEWCVWFLVGVFWCLLFWCYFSCGNRRIGRCWLLWWCWVSWGRVRRIDWLVCWVEWGCWFCCGGWWGLWSCWIIVWWIGCGKNCWLEWVRVLFLF